MGAKEVVIRQGEVVAVDENIKSVKAGDILIFPEYAHHTIKIKKSEEYIFVKEEEVICKL